MARWVDVRVPGGAAAQAVEAVLMYRQPLTFRVDLFPPASGREVEVSVQDLAEHEVRAALERQGIPVLAIRSRVDEQLAV